MLVMPTHGAAESDQSPTRSKGVAEITSQATRALVIIVMPAIETRPSAITTFNFDCADLPSDQMPD